MDNEAKVQDPPQLPLASGSQSQNSDCLSTQSSTTTTNADIPPTKPPPVGAGTWKRWLGAQKGSFIDRARGLVDKVTSDRAVAQFPSCPIPKSLPAVQRNIRPFQPFNASWERLESSKEDEAAINAVSTEEEDTLNDRRVRDLADRVRNRDRRGDWRYAFEVRRVVRRVVRL